MKLLQKNFYENNTNGNQSILNANNVNSNCSTPAIYLNDFTNDDETVLNTHIALELNENKFHLSPSDTNFFYEKFEHELHIKNNMVRHHISSILSINNSLFT